MIDDESVQPESSMTKEEREKLSKRSKNGFRPWWCPRCQSAMQPQDDYYYEITEMCELCYIEVNKGFRPKSLYDAEKNIIGTQVKQG